MQDTVIDTKVEILRQCLLNGLEYARPFLPGDTFLTGMIGLRQVPVPELEIGDGPRGLPSVTIAGVWDEVPARYQRSVQRKMKVMAKDASLFSLTMLPTKVQANGGISFLLYPATRVILVAAGPDPELNQFLCLYVGRYYGLSLQEERNILDVSFNNGYLKYLPKRTG